MISAPLIFTYIRFTANTHLEDEFYQKVQQKSVGLLAMKPLGGGRMRNARACLNFLKPYRALIPCVGIEKIEEMTENIQIWESREDLDPEGIPVTTVNFIKVFSYQMPRERVVTEKNSHAVEMAKGCTECNQCRERCPYDLDIPAMLKDNIAFYEKFARQSPHWTQKSSKGVER